MFGNEAVYAINQDQLWLPRDYYRHFRALYDAAEMSEKTERCQYVIAGTLSQERSKKAHPVFVITCRDDQRQTFAYIVDGLSLEILNRPASPDPELMAEQELQLKREKQWLACYEQINRRTEGLRSRAGLTQDMPESSLDEKNDVTFAVDFKASTEAGDTLHFFATCEYNADKKIIDINRFEEPVTENLNQPNDQPASVSIEGDDGDGAPSQSMLDK